MRRRMLLPTTDPKSARRSIRTLRGRRQQPSMVERRMRGRVPARMKMPPSAPLRTRKVPRRPAREVTDRARGRVVLHRMRGPRWRRGKLALSATTMTGQWALRVRERLSPREVLPEPPSRAEENVARRHATTIREQLEAHRADPACAMCHRKIDPWGFALENFDPIGRFRRHYGTKSRTLIDASATLPGGQSASGVADLKRALADREPFLVRSLTSALLTHALGRRMGPSDRVAIERIIARTEASDHGLLDLISECVADPIFQSP